MSDFDPDAYLSKKEGEVADFDPDAYLTEKTATPIESGIHGLADGATFGWMDEASGVGEAAGRALGIRGIGGKFSDLEFSEPDLDFKKNYFEGRDRKREIQKAAKAANPKAHFAGELGGGVASTLLPGFGAAKTLKGAMSLGAGVGGLSGAGHSEAEDAEGMIKDAALGAGIGSVGGAVGYGVGKGIEKGANYVSKNAGPVIAKALPSAKKENAAEIENAARILGIKPTPGMTSSSESLQKLESSLHQAPTIGGYLTRRGTKPVIEGMEDATEGLVKDAATISPYESGEQVKKILAKEVEGKFKPSIDVFDDLRQYTKDIPSTQASVKRVSKNIMKIPEVETLDLPFAGQIVRQLEKKPSVDGIKMLRTMVGKKARSATDDAEASAYWQMYAKLGRLEENTLKRGVIASAATKGEGDTIAKGMLGQLKGAKRGYAEQMTNLEDVAQAARLGKFDGSHGFIEKIDAIPSERLQEKMLPLEDVRLAQTMQKQFPEAFGGLRKARLRDLSDNLQVDGEYLPGRLLQRTKGLNPEAKQMLFGGDGTQRLDALRTVHQSLPEKVGPSGTQQAFDVKEMLNPWNQIKDLARFGGYKYASSERLAKLGEFLKTKPQFKNMAETNPRAFQAAVYQLSKHLPPEGGISKVAGDKPVSEEDAQQAFVEGN